MSKASIVDIGETKLEDFISSGEIEIGEYDLLRLDRSRRGGGFACYIKRSLAYNYKDNFAKALRVSLLIFSYQKRNQY